MAAQHAFESDEQNAMYRFTEKLVDSKLGAFLRLQAGNDAARNVRAQ